MPSTRLGWAIGCVAGAVGLPLLFPVAAVAQSPAGSEFQVNTVTTGEQDLPSLAIAPDGRFLAAWRTSDGDSNVSAQLFDARGHPAGLEFRVNTDLAGNQFPVGLAAIRNDGYVVVWAGPDGSDLGVHGRRIGADGAPLGNEFRLNDTTEGQQAPRAVASASDGTFVVVWDGPDGTGGFDVFGRRFRADGGPRGAEFRVNVATSGIQADADVAFAPGGEFVVTWTSFEPSGASRGIFARRYASDGAPLSGEFLVSTVTTGQPIGSSVALDAGGSFVVVWSGPDGSDRGIRGQRFDADGSRLGAEFLVNTSTSGDQVPADLAGSADGGFVVTWTGPGQEIVGRRYGRSGLPRGPEFRVNSYVTGVQFLDSVASDPAGNFVAAWASEGQDGSFMGVFGQRYGGLRPASLRADLAAGPESDGNAVFEACETAVVEPAWRNDTGATLAFSSAAGAFTGPAGATYSIADAGGDYGAVLDGETASCADTGDCLALTVSCVPARPALHWDAALLEEIVPAAQGQVQRWAVHLGDSFADVPRGSGFYRFVETLLHNGVTGGCDQARYCPLASTTREQMAAFVLLARERTGYASPDCAAPVFADVPASSPFCPWIEELARRGVVSGCGGGNYCPASPVTREQAAVFVLRTLDPALDPPPCTTPVFGDVPASSPFCRWIEELTRRGVVSGCGGGNYCPRAPVTRDQMAVFVSVTFGLTLYAP